MTESAQLKSRPPEISIIIPFYNRENFLGEAIESVLAQTFENWELILIDDGSKDNSANIARRFVEKFPHKIRLFAHENFENRGASSSRNLGIKHSIGDFITFLDSDDVFFPETLEIEMKAFAENPNAEAICGTIKYWFSWNAEFNRNERDFVVNLGVQTRTTL